MSNPILETLLNFFELNLEGFEDNPVNVKVNLIKMVIRTTNKMHNHKSKEGYTSVSYQMINSYFGRDKFKIINACLKLFIVTKNWSKKNGTTRGFKLTTHAAHLYSQYLNEDAFMSELVFDNGKYMKTLPKNVIENEVTATNRKYTNLRKTSLVSLVVINQLIDSLREIEKETSINVDITMKSALSIRKHAYTKVAGFGEIIQRYKISRSGRLYSGNLQNCSTLVRKAALAGFWDYDFENCHFSIFHQLAARIDIDCTAIKHYLSHKAEVRATIAKEVGITIKQVKTCLLAMMYGAKESTWHNTAIPLAIDTHDLKKSPILYKHPLFSAISKEISSARYEIVKQWPDTNRRSIINAMGLPISKTENDKFIMSHITQGLEARMLRIAIDYYGDSIALLLHDGFVTDRKIDASVITRWIWDILGLRMELSCDLVTPWSSGFNPPVRRGQIYDNRSMVSVMRGDETRGEEGAGAGIHLLTNKTLLNKLYKSYSLRVTEIQRFQNVRISEHPILSDW